MSAPSPSVLYEARDGVAVVTLNRPAVLNSLNVDMMRELTQIFQRLSAPTSDVRCVVLTGAGRAFSAGVDLTDASTRSAWML